LGTGLLLSAAGLSADPVAVINALRTGGCGDRPAIGTRVLPHATLDRVAQELSRGDRLEDALDRIEYPAASATSFHVRGSREDDIIRRMLAARHCESIDDPQYDEIGVFLRNDETWIVLAVRQITHEPLEPRAVAERVLELVNAARAQRRKCGREQFEAAQPLALSAMLNEAALRHARDMAERGSLGHQGSDGSQSGDRITRAGYRWRGSGENVAAGQRDADAVVAAWLDSPDHCATLMGPLFTEMGVAFALAPSKNPAIYLAQAFAVP
jgi:uncharacterized protein YkwD